MPLQDYKDIVGALASIVTAGQLFSGLFICRDIVRQGNTKNIPDLPFIGGIGISVLFFKYALILNDPGMIPINLLGMALNVGYLLCYYVYTTEKTQLLKRISKAAVGFGSILLYAALEDPAKVEFRFGTVVTALMLALIASPFAQLGEVMRTQSTESLPFPLILSGTLVSSLWLLYGIIIENTFVQIQNLVGLVLSLGQLSLFVIYPQKVSHGKQKTS